MIPLLNSAGSSTTSNKLTKNVFHAELEPQLIFKHLWKNVDYKATGITGKYLKKIQLLSFLSISLFCLLNGLNPCTQMIIVDS